MSERQPWWKAFLPKKKSSGHKDAGLSHTFGPDFDPFAQRPEKSKDPAAAAASKPATDHADCQTDSSNSPSFRDTYDDSHLDSFFNEQTCRRNMDISRSGRFKVKRSRYRIPLQEKETERGTAGKEDVRYQGGIGRMNTD
ncbi:proline-rich protein 15 [Thalassophryne amazonica]|uniref:proline-rich protein 15 n=1 Tax=Thalassophryne amazonica TaxID=390379 RepID=UPI0014708F4B|nr:proline-rich protein 15 [Thalassophryne amazonica]